MNRIFVTCLLLGMLVSRLALAQTTESSIANTQSDLDSQVGPEEKPDGFVIYRGCTSSVKKVASFGKIREVLDAAAQLTETPSRSFTWVALGNLEHANSLAKANRDSLRTKNCYVYTKSLRCGIWTLRLKSLTFQEAEAYAATMKDRTPTAIIYELE